MRDARLKPDPVDLAIHFLRDDMTPEEARMELVLRHRDIKDQIALWRSSREHAEPFLNDMESMIYEHAMRRLDLELQWHQELLQRLPELLASISPDSPGDI